ncbi:MAG TPA: hypothetical protein VHI97_05825, partial [Actinomycetota bacterium]|nr:hypothetical protein [Actinomycetota bacterium]
NGARVDAASPVIVRVAVQNGSTATSPTDTTGGHLHLYLDGRLQQMPYTTEAQVQVTPGTHQVRVEYVDPRHVPFNPPVESSITITAVGGPTGAVPG